MTCFKKKTPCKCLASNIIWKGYSILTTEECCIHTVNYKYYKKRKEKNQYLRLSDQNKTTHKHSRSGYFFFILFLFFKCSYSCSQVIKLPIITILKTAGREDMRHCFSTLQDMRQIFNLLTNHTRKT